MEKNNDKARLRLKYEQAYIPLDQIVKFAIPLNYFQRKCFGGKLRQTHEKINHLTWMTNCVLKIKMTRGPNIKRVFIQGIRIEFRILAMNYNEKGTRETTEGIELPAQESNKMLKEKESFK